MIVLRVNRSLLAQRSMEKEDDSNSIEGKGEKADADDQEPGGGFARQAAKANTHGGGKGSLTMILEGADERGYN